MTLHFTHPWWLLALLIAVPWVVWLTWTSDVQISRWRRWTALALRLLVLVMLVFALAGLQWHKRVEGMNVFFLLDRSDSVPSAQQEKAEDLVYQMLPQRKKPDKAGEIIFGTDAGIDRLPAEAFLRQKIQAVVGTERSDLAAAIRLGTAAFPETGQKRLVLMSDGNENLGDALAAVESARALGVTVDVVPLGITRGNDVAVQKLGVPAKLKKGQSFEAKIFVQSDRAQSATVKLFRNEQFLGEQRVQLEAGKNLFTFPQTLPEPGFYGYDVQVEASGDLLPQNNRAAGFASVQGDPRVLLVSAEPDQDSDLLTALRSAKLEIKQIAANGIPNTLAELQSYDAIFLSNVAAGDLGADLQALLEAAVRDFGVGLVCVGGDQTYAAGGYRGTPLERTLPVSMELDSKKVLPSGAVVLVMHGMEFNNGNQVARDCAQGVLAALGPQDEIGVVLWDGNDQWYVPLQKAANKRAIAQKIAGMNQGDLPSFQGVMTMAYNGLKKSTSNLKHIIVFSDGDPGAPSEALMKQIVGDRITVSTVLISGHAGPDTMVWIADRGKGRFYNVLSPDDLPQIFLKEAAVILKSAIYEDPFKPQLKSSSEAVRGIGAEEYPTLLGYVATSPKPRAETPLWTDKGDPLLAHWQYGLGRAVAFTSDAKSRWARNWLSWDKYRQFWTQIAQWSLRRVENADFTTEVSVDKGEGIISVEALDEKGNYRNFLNLQAVVVSPKGERQTVRLEQSGPGHYEARFPTKEVGAYALNLVELKEGKVQGSQVVGASVNYSPEFSEPEPNHPLLRRIAEVGGGRILDPRKPADNPFAHDRVKTFQPRSLWEWLLRFAILLFPLDVAVRRIELDRAEWAKATRTLRRWIFFWQRGVRPAQADESLAALLAKRGQVRATTTAPAPARPELFKPEQAAPVPTISTQTGPPAPAPGVEREPTPVAVTAPPPPPAEEAATTTSRLLEAKRRAQRRKE